MLHSQSSTMPESKPFVTDFGLKVFLPTLAAAVGMALLLLYLFNSIFQETNNLDDAYARRAAAAAVMSLQEQLESTVQDNARWNDAVEHSYGTADQEWLAYNWTVDDNQTLYDAVFVVDPAGNTVFSSERNLSPGIRDAVTNYMDPDISLLLGKLPARGGAFAKASGLVGSRQGVSVVAVATIVPNSSDVAMPDAPTLRLVLVRTLTPRVFEKLAKQFVLDGLHLQSTAELSQTALDIHSPSGQTLGTLAWNERSPGWALRTKYANIVWSAITLFLAMVGALIYICWRGFRQAHENRAEAVSASLRDELTGLANRRHLMTVLAEKLADARQSGGGLSVVYADLDGFKEVNDSYGHEIGDQLLKTAGRGFAALAVDADMVARLGGDEFAMIVSGPNAAGRARKMAQAMIAFVAEPLMLEHEVTGVTISAGVVDATHDDADIEEVLRRADVAMYAAKSAGRNRLHSYDPALDWKREEHRAIARELREAMDTGTLNVAYQTIIDARTRRTVGVEALARWPNSDGRHFGPEIFVAVAEQFGMIHELGLMVMRQACHDAARWSNIFVSVNVSPIQFMNPAFAETVEKVLRETGLDPHRLELEVTESVIISNADRAAAIIERLHNIGVSLALDDFGTGYSSIGHLRRFKFDKLKIDRSMVADILHQPAALRLVQGTIAMADALGMRVTAEGVEDEHQVSVLRLAGCSQFQGYLFSTPKPAAEISAAHIERQSA
ncbi:EAL domain-containing protein [Aestuariivirga sp.]|uniref:bifunctional diguanylate cyclase/phosphodiesterase n=1 Tax=Aestuariivirga sp. TaxID=2650926 RepID=UPI0039E4BF83